MSKKNIAMFNYKTSLLLADINYELQDLFYVLKIESPHSQEKQTTFQKLQAKPSGTLHGKYKTL
jgi:hypothetical protein